MRASRKLTLPVTGSRSRWGSERTRRCRTWARALRAEGRNPSPPPSIWWPCRSLPRSPSGVWTRSIKVIWLSWLLAGCCNISLPQGWMRRMRELSGECCWRSAGSTRPSTSTWHQSSPTNYPSTDRLAVASSHLFWVYYISYPSQVTMLICNNGKVNKSGTADFDTTKFIEKAKKLRRRNWLNVGMLVFDHNCRSYDCLVLKNIRNRKYFYYALLTLFLVCRSFQMLVAG